MIRETTDPTFANSRLGLARYILANVQHICAKTIVKVNEFGKSGTQCPTVIITGPLTASVAELERVGIY